MKQDLRILMVGAGGVASYLFPALANTFNLSGLLYDADILEEHNLDRQVFDKRDIGKGKAASLLRKNGLTKTVKAVEQYLEDSTLDTHTLMIEEAAPQFVICVADNHPARRAAIYTASRLNIPIAIGANEYSTSQALFWIDSMADSLNPMNRYPELRTSNEGSPIRCAEALISTPQLAIANQVTAALVNWGIYLWHTAETPNLTGLPVEFQTTFGEVETVLHP